MIKLKSPIALTAIAACLVYAGVVLTEEEPAATARKAKGKAVAAKSADPSVAAVHFGRYAGTGRDAFWPEVVTERRSGKRGVGGDNGQGSWLLTGIAVVDGSRSALVENSSTHETAFLRLGDRWQGLRVAEVTQTSVLFRDGRSRASRLSFAVTEPEASSPARAATAPAPAAVPTMQQPQPQMQPPPMGFPQPRAASAPAGTLSLGPRAPSSGSEVN